MKQLIIFLMASVVMLTSCKGTKADFRAKRLIYNNYSFKYVEHDNIVIVEADTAYRPGDTIQLNYNMYVLKEQVKR